MLYQIDGSAHRAAGSEHVINHKHPFLLRHTPLVYFKFSRAVLKFVRLAERCPGEFPFFADRHERHSQLVCDDRSKEETAGLQRGYDIGVLRPRYSEHFVNRLTVLFSIIEQSGDIIELYPLLGEILDDTHFGKIKHNNNCIYPLDERKSTLFFVLLPPYAIKLQLKLKDMNITKLDQIVELVKSKPKKRLVAANANDEHTIQAVNAAVDMGVIDATLVGDSATIEAVCKNLGIDTAKFNIVHETSDVKAAAISCDLINNGEGDILMKGLLPTDKYMHAILNKERGLCPPKATLSHVTVIENPAYHKLLIVGDVAIIPAPDLKQKKVILRNVVTTAKAMGIEKPKVALIACSEQMLPGVQACIDAALLAKDAERTRMDAYVDGPLSLDIAINKDAADLKGVKNQVAGDADCLVFPNIETGNVFYKCCTKFNHAELGAIIMGAKIPCVLSSRGDTAKTKLYSIALAALLAK